jgi:hypothetical protein
MFRQRYGIPLSQAQREELDLTCPVHPVRRISKWLIFVGVDKDGIRLNRPRTPEAEEHSRLIEEYGQRRRAQFVAADEI